MKKLLSLTLILFLFPLVALAVPEVSTEISSYDFGEVPQGDKVSYTFRFKNSGDELLEISSVSSSCGCTAALLSSKRIAAGDMGEIKATFDSSRFRGRVIKTITMKTNSPSHPQVQFKLQGEVKELLSVSTNRVVWNLGKPELAGHSTVKIKNQSQQDIRLNNARSTHERVKFEIDQLELAPGEEATLSINGSLPEGEKRLNAYVLVDTDFKPLPQIRVAISARLSN